MQLLKYMNTSIQSSIYVHLVFKAIFKKKTQKKQFVRFILNKYSVRQSYYADIYTELIRYIYPIIPYKIRVLRDAL